MEQNTTFQENEFSPVRVLIVDDHPNTAEMLARVIRKLDAPVEVLTALSGEEALEQLGGDSVDMLITDFMMPGMNGLNLIEKLHATSKPEYTVLVTAYDTPGLSATTRRLDIQNYLVKPVDPERIRDIVTKALEEILSKRMAGRNQERSQPYRILVADDNPDNVRLLSVRLKSEGYDYVTALDGLEVLEKMRQELPDLVLLDVNMPNMDGFRVLREMQKDPQLATVPVILVSAARISVKDVQEGLSLGADDYIVKPVEWRELSARIRAKLRVKQAEDALRLRARELGVLPAISHDLSERLDIEGLTQAVLKRTVKALEADNGFLTVFHSDGSSSLQMHKMIDFSPWTWGQVQQRLCNDGLVAKVVDTQKGIIIEDTQTNNWWFELPNDNTRSAIAVPLMGRSDVLGVILLSHQSHNHFQPDHLNILQAIASQAAIAIENASLYTNETKRVSELVALNHLTRTINQYTHSEDLYEKLPELIRQALHYPMVSLWLLEGEQLQLRSVTGADDECDESALRLGPEQAVKTGHPAQLSGSLEEDSKKGSDQDEAYSQSVIAVPLFLNDEITGALSIHSCQINAFQESDRVLLETISMQYESALQRIQLFEAAEQEKIRMSAVLQAAADAILLVGKDGDIQLVNLEGERLFTDVTTQIGHPLPKDKGYDELISFLDEARQIDGPRVAEIVWPDKRVFTVHATPVMDGSLVIVLNDVTHFKDLERIKNEFIATASHDLKNPISVVMGYSSLLEKAGPLNDQQREFVNGLHRASTQMYELVLNLLEMARLDLDSSLQLKSYDIEEMLGGIISEFEAQAQTKGHTLKFEPSQEQLQVEVDLPRIRQVIQNLVGNSIKYSPSNGSITITTERQDMVVWVSVCDTGLGIPEEDLAHIFDKFYRVQTSDRTDIQGNGLGLAIVKAIVEEHGGSVDVESVFGEGSCFKFSLPIAVDKQEPAEALSTVVENDAVTV